MNKMREDKDMKQIKEDKRVGSGKNWTHRLTVPKEPSLSYKRGRSKGTRKKVSMERHISKELLARNISLENIKTNDYFKEDDFKGSFHNHFYQEDESDTMLQTNEEMEQIRQNKYLIAGKILENNQRANIVNSQNSMNGGIMNQQNEFSRSCSNVEQLRAKALQRLSPKEGKREG